MSPITKSTSDGSLRQRISIGLYLLLSFSRSLLAPALMLRIGTYSVSGEIRNSVLKTFGRNTLLILDVSLGVLLGLVLSGCLIDGSPLRFRDFYPF